ncbi:adenosine deaminase, tRNA-specific 3 [Entophlyctis sp. JEL0112]|nr:adenosine deaminase, tRNA-specific 3 [Entophlyctis sp. JEL0112]
MTVKCTNILADDYTRTLETVDVFVASITDPKTANAAIKFLASAFPVPASLEHLKRIRRTKTNTEANSEPELSVLVCPVPRDASDDSTDVAARVSAALNSCPALCNTPLRIVPVAAYPPVTRDQLREWSALWPLSFHEPRKEAPVVFTDADLAEIEENFRALDGTALHNSNEDNGHSNSGATPSKLKTAAAMFDPNTHELLCVCVDARHIHPLHHAAMQAIAAVAQRERALRSSLPLPANSAKRKSPAAAEPSMVSSADDIADARGYLCTGLDVYLTREPCVMCSMALLHSRVRRVFYLQPRPDGGLGSAHKIHVHTQLNHKFRVFKVELV